MASAESSAVAGQAENVLGDVVERELLGDGCRTRGACGRRREDHTRVSLQSATLVIWRPTTPNKLASEH
jgi:hypothetical protein